MAKRPKIKDLLYRSVFLFIDPSGYIMKDKDTLYTPSLQFSELAYHGYCVFLNDDHTPYDDEEMCIIKNRFFGGALVLYKKLGERCAFGLTPDQAVLVNHLHNDVGPNVCIVPIQITSNDCSEYEGGIVKAFQKWDGGIVRSLCQTTEYQHIDEDIHVLPIFGWYY